MTRILGARALLVGGVGALLAAQPVLAAEFKYDAKANEQLAKKLNIPVHFALPASARAPLQQNFNTSDKLIDFKHPDAVGAKGDVGLRLVVTKRSGLSEKLGKSGLIQTGDILLTFRPEWGGAGAYPNIQMGVSHAGIAYVQNGKVYNLDNPLSEEYLGRGMRGDLTSEHYRTLNYMHVIRPRNLTNEQRANILAWATRINKNARTIYPKQISFNSNYNAPKFQPGKPLTFVKTVGQAALAQSPAGPTDLFCSEFAWSVLSLRSCDPGKTAEAFKGSGVPSCVSEVMKPMQATGDYAAGGGSSGYAGLTDGPLMVIQSLELPDAQEIPKLKAVFAENPAGLAKLSTGHRTLATEMQPKFAPLEKYYLGVAEGGFLQRIKARMISKAFKDAVAENYSPTSYLINTLLPPKNPGRSMDYVATVVIE